MQAMANIALRAGRRGAQILLRAMDRLDELKVEEKAPDDFVSNIDREAERAIVDALLKTYPDHAILAEEGSAAGANEGAEFTWIIDPLDGTLNYLQGIPTYVYKVGLIDARYSFSAAVDLFRTVINFTLLVSVNRIAKLLGQSGLW